MVEQLTNRERQVVSLIASGKTTKQIARALEISFKTAVSHRYSAQAKLGAKNAAGMICKAFQLGLIEPVGEKPEDSAPAARFSGMFAEQSKVREDLRASLQESTILRRRSAQLLDELQTVRAQMRLLVRELRQASDVRGQTPGLPVTPRNRDLNAPKLNGGGSRRVVGRS